MNTRKDAFWGVGRDGKCGANTLGGTLAATRLAFRSARVRRDGLCSFCGTEPIFVSTVSAAIFPYCSPGCRVKLGLPEEEPAEAMEAVPVEATQEPVTAPLAISTKPGAGSGDAASDSTRAAVGTPTRGGARKSALGGAAAGTPRASAAGTPRASGKGTKVSGAC